MRHALAAVLALIPLSPLGAHPHIFVDTELRLVADPQGRLVSVEMTWTYDDFFSLLIFEDMGLDPDADGVLDDAELAQLKGFDLIEWPEGFEGDIYLTRDDEKLELALPEATGIAVVAGRIVASHSRAVDPVSLDGVMVQQFDPTYYVAYTLQSVDVPSQCQTLIDRYDPTRAASELDRALREVPEEEFEVLEIGHLYADTVKVECKSGA